MTTDEKLSHFLEACVSDATSKSDKMLDSFQKIKEEEYQKHVTLAKENQELHIQDAKKTLLREKNIEYSQKLFAIEREYTLQTNEIKDMIFNELKDKLERFMSTSKYSNMIYAQINQAKQIAGNNPLLVTLDPSDELLLETIQANTGVEICIAKKTFGGGTIIQIPNRNILIDNSFNNKLAKLKESFRFNGGLN